jgi:hypothetical protein
MNNPCSLLFLCSGKKLNPSSGVMHTSVSELIDKLEPATIDGGLDQSIDTNDASQLASG